MENEIRSIEIIDAEIEKLYIWIHELNEQLEDERQKRHWGSDLERLEIRIRSFKLRSAHFIYIRNLLKEDYQKNK